MRKLITFRCFDAESKTEFTNNSLNSSKTRKLFKGWNQGPGELDSLNKTQIKKSLATTQLKVHVQVVCDVYNCILGVSTNHCGYGV